MSTKDIIEVQDSEHLRYLIERTIAREGDFCDFETQCCHDPE